MRFAVTGILLFFFHSIYGKLVVKTPLGQLEGVSYSSRDNKPYYGFRGIPYAKKPDRFQVSEPHPSWNGVKQATTSGNACPQFDITTKTIIGDDDCLFLNVYSPSKSMGTKDKSQSIPVMVWFHPGAFELGRSDDYDPKYFMDEDIILVTVNYRLGALGFLSTQDELAPGNLGLKDQNLALKWVQSNIHAFGGDPARVTIFGNSAGAASVHYHILSPMSKGLFRNGISQSGTALSPFARQQDPKLIAQRFGDNLECSTKTSEALLECIKSKTIPEIIMAQMKLVKWAIFPFSSFAPVVEPENSKLPKFLDETPLTLMSSGKFNHVPWIVGFVEDEGTIVSSPVILNENFTNQMNNEWDRNVPIALIYDHLPPSGSRDNLTTKILKLYFGPEDINEETWDGLTKMFSDRYFTYPADKSARLHSKFSPVYPYEFAFPGEHSPFMKVIFGISEDHGIAHGDDMQYHFSGLLGTPEYTNKGSHHEAFEFSQKFVKLWTSFATHNEPTATWEKALKWDPIPNPIKKSGIKYYQIAEKTEISNTVLKERMSLWEDVELEINKFQSEEMKPNQKDEL